MVSFIGLFCKRDECDNTLSHEWLMWMGHVTDVDESCHWCGWVMSLTWRIRVIHVIGCCHTYAFVRYFHTRGPDLSLTWTSHVTCMNESCHIHNWVMSLFWTSHARMSHVTHTNEWCHTYEWVSSHTYEWFMSHIQLSRVTLMKESHVRCEWVKSHIRMSHVTHVNESCHTCDSVTVQFSSIFIYFKV